MFGKSYKISTLGGPLGYRNRNDLSLLWDEMIVPVYLINVTLLFLTSYFVALIF